MRGAQPSDENATEAMAQAMVPLVIRYGRIGDMVLQAPLLHCLHLRYGRPCKLLSSGAWPAALFSASPDVAVVKALRGRHTPFFLSLERWALVAWLKRHRGPVYVSEDVDRQVARIRWLLNAAGIPSSHCVFLNDCAQLDEHWVDRLVRFGAQTPLAWSASDYPLPAADTRRTPTLDVTPEESEDCERWLKRRGLAGVPIVLLQPGSKHSIKWGRQRNTAKAWPSERWSELIRLISVRLPGVHTFLCGCEREERFLQSIRLRGGIDNVTVVTTELPLRRMMALMQVAHSMISVDTGPAHVAAALTCPVVVIYGAESPKVWGRRSLTANAVMELGGYPECASAASISVDAVYDAWLNLVRRPAVSPHAGLSRRCEGHAELAVAPPSAAA